MTSRQLRLALVILLAVLLGAVVSYVLKRFGV
jgi:hypothetical protein